MNQEEREWDEEDKCKETNECIGKNLAKDCVWCEGTGWVIKDTHDEHGEHKEEKMPCHCQLG